MSGVTANEHRASFQGDENLLVLVLDQCSTLCIQAHLRDTAGLVPDHFNKANVKASHADLFGLPVHI